MILGIAGVAHREVRSPQKKSGRAVKPFQVLRVCFKRFQELESFSAGFFPFSLWLTRFGTDFEKL